MEFMAKYKCPCKYVYDPEKGDPKSGIAPGTPFEDLPDDWRVPASFAGRSSYKTKP